jgi:hypothetical protein
MQNAICYRNVLFGFRINMEQMTQKFSFDSVLSVLQCRDLYMFFSLSSNDYSSTTVSYVMFLQNRPNADL